MGNIGKCGERPYKFTLNDLKDVNIDDSKEMPKGCGPDTHENQEWLKKRGFGWPDNDEFQWGGLGGGCGLCSNIDEGYGCECHGGDAIVGKRGRVKRIHYKADPKDCCLANMEGKDKNAIIGSYTCHPDNRNPGHTSCSNIYRDYCKESDNLFNPNCQALKNTNSSIYNQLMQEKCNTEEHYNSSMCRNWCSTNKSLCTMLDTTNKCVQYKITDPECTEQKVSEVQNLCKTYKIIEGLDDLGYYPCNLNGIKLLEDNCKEVNIDLDSCSPTALDLEENRLELQKTREQNAEQNERTEKTFNEFLQPTTTPAPSSEEDYTIYIIAIIIFISLLFSFSSIGGILVFMSGEKA